jgi:hypothetical protein
MYRSLHNNLAFLTLTTLSKQIKKRKSFFHKNRCYILAQNLLHANYFF